MSVIVDKVVKGGKVVKDAKPVENKEEKKDTKKK